MRFSAENVRNIEGALELALCIFVEIVKTLPGDVAGSAYRIEAFVDKRDGGQVKRSFQFRADEAPPLEIIID